MTDVRFGEVRHIADLARVLSTTVEVLTQFADTGSQAASYTAIRLRKKGKRRKGEFRTVYKVAQELRLLHKNIAAAIGSVTEFDDHVQGFVAKRSIVTNATLHLGQKRLLHADIHRFFESITLQQIEAAFESLGCASDVAAVMARICSLDGHLPEGSSASPILANLVARFLDADLKNLARAHDCKYTRYADDITFSGDSIPDCSRVASILTQHGFMLRDGKCRIQRRGRSQYVTGLTTVDTLKPRIPRIIKRRLRLELYYATRFGLDDHLHRVGSNRSPGQEMNRLGGWISFMSSAEGKESTRWLYDRWRKLVGDAPSNGE